jgi:hypothetical protein
MLPIALLPTTADQAPLIRNLYQFYSYESSDWEQEDVEVDGRFYIHDEHLQRYWQDDGWAAYLVLADGFIAGFVLGSAANCEASMHGSWPTCSS